MITIKDEAPWTVRRQNKVYKCILCVYKYLSLTHYTLRNCMFNNKWPRMLIIKKRFCSFNGAFIFHQQHSLPSLNYIFKKSVPIYFVEGEYKYSVNQLQTVLNQSLLHQITCGWWRYGTLRYVTCTYSWVVWTSSIRACVWVYVKQKYFLLL